MKSLLIISLLLFFSISGKAQSQWLSASSFGALSHEDHVIAMCTNAIGESYFSGTFYQSIIFGNDTLTTPTAGTFLVKLDSAGNSLWAITPGGSGELEVNAMAVDDSDYLYLAGSLRGVVIFGNDTISNSAARGIFLGKFAMNGNLIWAQSSTGSGNVANGVTVDNNSDVYVTGTYDSSITLGSTFLQGGAGIYIFTAKCDYNGNYLWAKSSSNSYTIGVNGITCDKFNNICIAGYFTDSLTFGTYTINSPANGSASVLLVKYDASGNVLWAKNSGGFPSSGQARSISSDSLGNFYCAGYFNSAIMIFENDTLINHVYQGVYFNDIFLVKYDNNGNLIWAISEGGQGYDEPYSIKTDDAGNTFMTGFFKGSISFGGTFFFGQNQDLFVVKFDAYGNLQWAESASGTLNEVGVGIGIDNYNHVYVTGDFSSPTSNFGPYTITNTDIFTGSYDIFYSRLGDYITATNDFQNDSKNGVLIYPNPAKGFCHVINNYETESIIRIYNIEGKLMSEELLNSDGSIDLKNLPSGLYCLQLFSKNQFQICKLIVQ